MRENVASHHGLLNRTPAPVEAHYLCDWRWPVGRRVVLLRSARLGHTHQLHHGGATLSDGLMFDARHG